MKKSLAMFLVHIQFDAHSLNHNSGQIWETDIPIVRCDYWLWSCELSLQTFHNGLYARWGFLSWKNISKACIHVKVRNVYSRSNGLGLLAQRLESLPVKTHILQYIWYIIVLIVCAFRVSIRTERQCDALKAIEAGKDPDTVLWME